MNPSKKIVMKSYGTDEFLSFQVTLNSNRCYWYMSKQTKAEFVMFCRKVFIDELPDYFVYRQWKMDRRYYIGRTDNDQAIPMSSEDLKFLESNINYEVGPVTGFLHAHVFIQIKCTKYIDYTADFFHNMLRVRFHQTFGQKAHVNFKRDKDESLKNKLYSMKNAKKLNSDPMLNGEESKILVQNL